MVKLNRIEQQCTQFSRILKSDCVLGPGGSEVSLSADVLVAKIERQRELHKPGGIRPRYDWRNTKIGQGPPYKPQ